MAEPSQKIPLYEKIGYSAADAAANFVFMTMILFQSAFYTDVMHLSAATAFYIILVPRLWDAFFDPVMGVLADRTRTRWGSFRPWIIWTAIPWGIIMFLAYTTPQGWGNAALVAYAVVTNTLLMTLYSANNMPYSALGGVMSGDVQERSKLNSFRFIAVNIAQFIVVGFTLVLVNKFAGPHTADLPKGDLAHGWEVTMGLYAALCVVLFLITFSTTKERIKPEARQKSSITQDLGDLTENSPWAVMFIFMLIHFSILAFRGGAEYQYYQLYADKGAMFDIIKPFGLTAPGLPPGETPHGVLEMLGYIVHGDRNSPDSNVANAVYGLIGMLGKVVTIISIMFGPLLSKAFGKKTVVVAGFALMILNSIAFYFLKPTDVGLMLLLSLTGSAFYGPTIPLVWAMFADVVDYSEWKTGRRATGIVYATIGFALKAGLALGASALLWVQVAKGYDAHPNSPEMIETFRICTTIVPGILFALCTALLIAYKLNKRLTIQIAEELVARRQQSAAQIQTSGSETA